jgi:putative ABC transport system substrate-binding protein
VRKSADLETAFGEMLAWPAQALMASSEYVVQARRSVAEFALRHRLPSACPSPEVVEAGGLFSYALSRAELMKLFTRSFEYVDRILRGARPADLPVERPDRYELVINLRTAKALGLKVPQAVLLRADSVIE